MGTFPNFSNIAKYATDTLDDRVESVYNVSKLNAWVRVTSGVKGSVGDGLTILSNPNFKLFGAAGVSSIYGSSQQSGTIGETWGGTAVNPSTGQGYRPSPIIDSIEIDEGAGNLSRKASFSIKCFSKEQMEIVTQYFLEPGFTVFLEWGWNTVNSMKGFKKTKKLSANTISKFQNFEELTKLRTTSGGEYDNYLGYITGGGISSEGDNWVVNIKCTGFTELPAYLVNGDNSGDGKGKNPKKDNDYKNLSAESNLNIKRWMFAFNALPSNRKHSEIKSLETKEDDSLRKVPIAHAVNYINFDETVANRINKLADGTMLSRAFSFIPGGATQNGEGTDIPGGAKIVGPEKFIRFGTLMKIFNTMIMDGLKIGKDVVYMRIDSSTCICSAYDRIFSIDKSKLFIPNNKTPKFSLIDAKNSTTPLETIPTESTDNSVSSDNIKIQFPFEGAITDNVVTINNISKNVGYTDSSTTKNGITKDERKWGFLDDLYVNFDFASRIMKSSNFTVKDALYQILNGMSSAVNDLWNFQIIQEPSPNEFKTPSGAVVKKGTMILTIKEMNFTYKPVNETPYTFYMRGTKSIFKDASLSMDMSGAKMNQVIGTRLASKINEDTSPNMGTLFAKGLTDLVLTDINSKKETTTGDSTAGTGKDETDKELMEKNYADFLGKLGTYPKVDKERGDIKKGFDINKICYVATYDDSQLLKMGKSEGNDTEVSILLPINFTFTIHGVSGIKRGDKFKVNGIPDKYAKQGFFQVLGIKHTIQGMEWVTEVTGGYRNATF